jgi:G3E family GTPase
MHKKIPTNIITGFLGTGKTTAILHLLAHKPAREKWAVLVNEFGEIGIDGAILAGHGAEIREVAGGCMCCVADLPMRVALNRLIEKTKPDRLLIEPTGLGHPQTIADALTEDYYLDVLDLRAVVCLVDPRKLRDARYTGNAIFNDQLHLADVIVANKTDLCDAADQSAFTALLAQMQPPKQASGWIEQGRLELQWLEPRHGGQRTAPRVESAALNGVRLPPQLPEPIILPPGQAFVRRENRGDGHFSCGWLFAEGTRFNFQQLLNLVGALNVTRLKGVMNTDRGAFVLNVENGVLGVNDARGNVDSIIELIHTEALDWQRLETALLAMRC